MAPRGPTAIAKGLAGTLDANDLWVGIMFQGDFLTKITLRFHRSHLWCEENLYSGPEGANGDSEGSRGDPGRE